LSLILPWQTDAFEERTVDGVLRDEVQENHRRAVSPLLRPTFLTSSRDQRGARPLQIIVQQPMVIALGMQAANAENAHERGVSDAIVIELDDNGNRRSSTQRTNS
jgi:hypothetical protein